MSDGTYQLINEMINHSINHSFIHNKKYNIKRHVNNFNVELLRPPGEWK